MSRSIEGGTAVRRLLYLVLAGAVVLAITGLAGTAGADTVDDCQAKIDALKVQTTSAELLGPNAEKDRAGLLDKLDAATTKLGEGKFSDAIQKLTDFRTKVEELNAAAEPKINPDDAAALIAGADDAIACIDSLQATAVAS
jgi:hypothetical protein